MVDPSVCALVFTNMLCAMGTFTVVPTLPFLAMRMGADAFSVSLLGPAFYVAQIFCCALVGAISDRIGRKRVLVMASLSQAGANLLLSRADSVPALLMANFFRGMTMSIAPVEMAYLMEASDSEERLGQYLVLQRFGLHIGCLCGPMAARIMSHHSFVFLCRGLVAINLLCGITNLAFLRDTSKPLEVAGTPASRMASPTSVRSRLTTPSKNVGVMDSIVKIFGNRSRATLLLLWFASSVSGGVCDGPEMVLFRDHFGFGVRQSCDFYMMGTLSAIIGTSLVHPMIHGVGPFRGLGPHAVCVLGAVGASLSTFSLVLLPGVPWIPYLYAVCMSGLSNAMFSLGFLHMLQKKCSRSTLGSFLGLTSALGSAGVTVGPPIGGVAYGVNNFAPPMITTVLYMTTAALFMYLLGDHDPEKAIPAHPSTLSALQEAGEEEEVIYMPTLLSQPVMVDKNFATRIFLNEVAQDMDPDLLAAYQAYRMQLGGATGIRCFSVAGDRLVDSALRGSRTDPHDSGMVRRSQTMSVDSNFRMHHA